MKPLEQVLQGMMEWTLIDPKEHAEILYLLYNMVFARGDTMTHSSFKYYNPLYIEEHINPDGSWTLPIDDCCVDKYVSTQPCGLK